MRAGLVLAVSRHAATIRQPPLALRSASAWASVTSARGKARPIANRSRCSSTSTAPRPKYTPRLNLDAAPPPPTDPSQPLPRSINPSSALLLLTIPQPPSAWPAKLEFASPLLGLASRALKSKGVVVNAVWDGESKSTEEFVGDGEEVYPARLYWPDGASYAFERFSKATIMSKEMRQVLGRKVDREKALSLGDGAVEDGVGVRREILVCTHGSRDCRCGETGGALVTALREEIERRGLQGTITVGEVAHVGGHKYAANAILVPSLDMISNLQPSHAPALLSWWLSGRDKGDDMWQHWRGRYGLTEIEQAGVWGGTGWAHGEEKVAEKVMGSELAEPAEKVGLRFKTFEGEMKNVEAGIGENLLTVGKREGLPAIEGVCGGKLECATCHVYIPSTAPIPEATEEELDMLGYALGYRDGESRLGCQIRVTKELADWAAGADGVISLPRY